LIRCTSHIKLNSHTCTLNITVLQTKLEPEQDEELNLILDEELHLSGDAAAAAVKTVSEENDGVFSASRATGSAAESQVSSMLEFAPRLLALQLKRTDSLFFEAAATARIVGKGNIFKAVENGSLDLVKDHIIADPSCIHKKNA
jgi:hypothetical protein